MPDLSTRLEEVVLVCSNSQRLVRSLSHVLTRFFSCLVSLVLCVWMHDLLHHDGSKEFFEARVLPIGKSVRVRLLGPRAALERVSASRQASFPIRLLDSYLQRQPRELTTATTTVATALQSASMAAPPVGYALRRLAPTSADEAALARFFADLGDPDTPVAGLFCSREPGVDVNAVVTELVEWSQGNDLPDGWVPHDTLFLFTPDGSTITACVNLRRRLTPFLRVEGGHIGYTVSPSFRRQGLGTLCLALALEAVVRGEVELETDPAMTHDDGRRCVLVTADTDNVGSRKIIERNHGRLIAEQEKAGRAVKICAYAVPLPAGVPEATAATDLPARTTT